MKRICPLPFQKESARYYRIKSAIESCDMPVSEIGTVFSERFNATYIRVTSKTGVDNVIRIR